MFFFASKHKSENKNLAMGIQVSSVIRQPDENQTQQNDSENKSENQLEAELEDIDLTLTNVVVETRVLDVNFGYDQESKAIKYKGVAIAPNGCITFQKTQLERQSEGDFKLTIFMKNLTREFPELICTQAISQTQFVGTLEVELRPEEIQNFSQLFRIEQVNQ